MDELAEKVDQVLIAAAAAAAAAASQAGSGAAPDGGWRSGQPRASAKSREASLAAGATQLPKQEPADQAAQQTVPAKSGGAAVAAADLQKGPQHKEVLQWGESLSQAFMRAWVQRVELPAFVREACRCGEGLMAAGQHALAHREVYQRLSDRALELQGTLDSEPDRPEKTSRIAACLRFYLGACMCLYRRTVQADAAARRPDTVHALRDVLRDILAAVKLANSWKEPVREELYWALYNAALLAMRVARWLRLHGFGGLCVPALTWLAESMQACLPFHAVHMLHFRTRFVRELVYCAESAQRLADARAFSDQAIKQLKAMEELEVKFPPVPEETQRAFEALRARLQILRLKYDFWLGTIADTTQLAAKMKEELGPDSTKALPCLLEVLQLQHGLSQGFAAAEPEPAGHGDLPDPQVIQSKQCDLIAAIIEQLQDQMGKAEAAAAKLDEFTEQRLAFEHQEELRASADPTIVDATNLGEAGQEAAEPLTAPQRPAQEELEALGFVAQSQVHSLEEALPLSAHVMLVRECLRHEMKGTSPKLEGKFRVLERSLVLRLRYRNFLCPPLVDIDVIVSAERSSDNVELPDGYEFLTGDLNALSLRNRQIESEENGDGDGEDAPGKPTSPYAVKPKGRHIYVVGQRFDAWVGWSPDYPAPIRRLCNLQVIFSSNKPPGEGLPTGASGFHDPQASKELQPIMQPYASAGAGDASGFDHVEETSWERDALLQQLTHAGHVSQKSLALPIEPHPGVGAGASGTQGGTKTSSTVETMPYLVFSVYDERALWVCDAQARAARPSTSGGERTTPPAGGAEAQTSQEHDATELPAWCALLDSAAAVTTPLVDISVFVTKQLHAPVPSHRFNAVIRADLRQTPEELLGRPFQSYIFVCAGVDAPAMPFIMRQLRVLSAIHTVHSASNGEAVAAGDPREAEEELESRPPTLRECLMRLTEVLERAVDGACGQLFLLEAADFFEDVCAYVFLTHIWPRLQKMQDVLLQHELQERIIPESEREELAQWSGVIRRLLPLLLRTLERVRTVDALTLGSAASALAVLFLQENDSRNAQLEVGLAITRLERELAEASTPGPQPVLDRPVAAAVSFDPPSLRPPNFALFDDAGGGDEDGRSATLLLLKGLSRNEHKGLSRVEQDCICLLTRLYERWIDCSLKVHLRNVASTVRRARKPNETVDEGDMHVAVSGPASTKISLSNQEAAVLAQLGENPYLRCIFFVVVARRRPETAAVAMGKACQEVEAALTQERQLWDFCEKELVRQQEILASGHAFGEEFRRSGQGSRKLRAHPPVVVSRSPWALRLRLPPLPGSPVPPNLPTAADLKPSAQDSEALHSQRLGTISAAATQLTCALYGKAAGAGTAVSEMHKELPGTGLRNSGFDCVEVSGLKPNTNYCFATMYFEGFEALRPAASATSETSPAIGSYYPLPVALLRAEICKAALRGGEPCKPAFSRAWGPLFNLLCERTNPAEEFDSCGLRTFKLRLDAAERLSPAVLAAFAEVALLRNGSAASSTQSGAFPATRPAQQAVLRSANECLIAVDCARRAGSAGVAFRGVSLTLRLVQRLLQYRTKPHLLLSLLAKCAASLESFELPRHQLPWFAQARVTASYLLHHVTVQCVQLRQVTALEKQLEGDSPTRYEVHELADARAQVDANARTREQAMELALLGGGFWQHAEGKAKIALQTEAAQQELLVALRELSERSYAKVAKDAAQLALQQESQAAQAESRQPFLAMTLLETAVAREWDQGNIEELPLADVLARPPSDALEQLLEARRKSFLDFGFLLRAKPPKHASFVPTEGGAAEGAQDGVEGQGSQQVEAAVASGGGAEEGGEEPQESTPPLDPAACLARSRDSRLLAHLELLRTGPWLKELCNLKLHRLEISSFKYFDLDQIAVPDVSTDAEATLAATDCSLEDTMEAEAREASKRSAQSGADERELEEWEVLEAEHKKNREEAFELLQKCLKALVRAGAYSGAACADQLLQTVLMAALNALLIVGPSPEECVPQGPKSNPQDTDPDSFLGVPPATQEEGAEAEAQSAEPVEGAAPENAMWVDLGILAELAVEMLGRRRRVVLGQEASAGVATEVGAEQPEGEDDEVREIRVANETSQAIEAAEEELQEVWFERAPEIDVASIGKLVAFASLCLYRMHRWKGVIALCRGFNDATCSVFATSFLPLIIGAQKEVCSLSAKALANTERYTKEAKATYEADQKALPRKLLRQLMLSGEKSEPEKLFQRHSEYYQEIVQRQKRLHVAWEGLFGSFEKMRSLVSRAVPAAVEQLRKSRVLLADFLRERQKFNLEVERGMLADGERKSRQRALGLAASMLTSSYRKAVELLRKRQMSDQVVQALHELGNLQWLEGDVPGAQTSWSDAVDTAYQYVYAIKNWQKCAETAVTPPKDAKRAELMLLTTVILAKYARLTVPKDATAHLHTALLASTIVEAVLMSALPHPSHRMHFSPDKYRLREIFFGLRESYALLPPNSVHGGLDGLTFLSSLAFFHNTFLAMDYQPARCLPLCALHNYVATDICRSARLAVKGRLMAVRALLRCRSLTSAWLSLYSISRSHDLPRSLLVGEALDLTIVEAQELGVAAITPYNSSEEPFTDANMQAIGKITDTGLVAEGSDVADTMGAQNLCTFRLLQAEFLVCVCSYGFVSSKVSDPDGKVKATCPKWLEAADATLCSLWKGLTGNDDCSATQDAGSEALVSSPEKVLTEEESELCVEIRLLRAWAWELQGDAGRAVREVLCAMKFLRTLAETGVKSSQDCRIASGGGEDAGGLRQHPGTKAWMTLRRRMVHLLIGQGRLQAADAHIEQGLQECQNARDEFTRIELLAAKVRVDVLSGRLLELRGEARFGAVPAAERCLGAAARHLPVPTVGAIYARMMLCTALQQNPALVGHLSPEASQQPLTALGAGADPNEEMVLEAQGKIVISPIAKDLELRSGAPGAVGWQAPAALEAYREHRLLLAALVEQCLQDIDRHLEVCGFELRPRSSNGCLNFGDGAEAAEEAQPRPPLLPVLRQPSLKIGFRVRPCLELPASDSREPPNIYLELLPLRLHGELRLAGLHLDLGDPKACITLLKDAEERMARCVHLLPWLYVEFCVLKLRWRRLSRQAGILQFSAPADAPNHVRYRDPKAFADGVCPPTDSPLYRTFMARATAPSLMEDTEWSPPGSADKEEALQEYLRELVAVLQIAAREGGHDCGQILALLREGLEEVLRVRPRSQVPTESTRDLLHTLFGCLVITVEARKALLFESSAGQHVEEANAPAKDAKKGGGAAKGAPTGPVPFDVAALPRRTALDIQGHLKRQGPKEGALAYSANALLELQKSIPFQTVVRHSIALRRECEMFASLFLADRLLCDQLHVALAQASDLYLNARVLAEAHIKAIEAPPEAPSNGDVLVHWAQPDYSASAGPPDERCALFAFICPQAEEPDAEAAMAARCSNVHREGLRRLWDSLSSDLDHCRPATAVTSAHVRRRLLAVTAALRGLPPEAEAELDVDATLSNSLQRLLGKLGGEEAGGEGEESPAASSSPTASGVLQPAEQLLDSQQVQVLLEALVRLLDRSGSAARISHPELGRFLRCVLEPLQVLPASGSSRAAAVTVTP